MTNHDDTVMSLSAGALGREICPIMHSVRLHNVSGCGSESAHSEMVCSSRSHSPEDVGVIMYFSMGNQFAFQCFAVGVISGTLPI